MNKPHLPLMAALALLLHACGPTTPSDTVKAYMTAMEDGDRKAMLELSTGDMRKAIEFMDEETLRKLAQSAAKQRPQTTVDSETIEGDKATVDLMIHDIKHPRIERMKLKNVGGQWKLSI